jgi:peptidylprolyl isomerase
MRLLLCAIAALAGDPLVAQERNTANQAPAEIVASAPPADWVRIAPSDLLVMELAPGRDGERRRVTIQLIAPPFAEAWVDNIRKLAASHWWDGLSVNRVQDNYVVQWGDAYAEDPTKARPLPRELAVPDESAYVVPRRRLTPAALGRAALERDSYAATTGFAANGWPYASDGDSAWPVHCYGMVGVGRGLSPDTGSGAELYAVIGHAPRHLDRNIALVGRAIDGIEHLSSLPRGTGELGFYETAGERVPIVSIRLSSEMEGDPKPAFEFLSTESDAFARYAEDVPTDAMTFSSSRRAAPTFATFLCRCDAPTDARVPPSARRARVIARRPLLRA